MEVGNYLILYTKGLRLIKESRFLNIRYISRFISKLDLPRPFKIIPNLKTAPLWNVRRCINNQVWFYNIKAVDHFYLTEITHIYLIETFKLQRNSMCPWGHLHVCISNVPQIGQQFSFQHILILVQ